MTTRRPTLPRLIRTWSGLGEGDRGAVVALGNFDGVHRGHQAVIAFAQKVANQHGAPMAVAVFSPHPRRFFQPDAPPFRLMSDSWRLRALGAIGVERVYEIPFDRDLSLMPARDFAERVLSQGLGARHVVIGFDYHFGKDRGGDAKAMETFGEQMGFGVSVQPRHDMHGQKSSSTAIREFLTKGEPLHAAEMLTRPWIVDGVVRRGDQRGRTIGFPTANVPLGALVRPKFGVYVVSLRIHGDDIWRHGVANIGRRPTVEGTEARVEAHVFDFDGDLYGRDVDIAVHNFLRAERKFEGMDALKSQIERDAGQAREIAVHLTFDAQ